VDASGEQPGAARLPALQDLILIQVGDHQETTEGAHEAPSRRGRATRARRPRRRTESGRLFPWVKATKRRRGYHDLKVKRRDGPVCDTCGRRHFPFQGCWSGPLDQRRDRADIRRQREESAALERARAQAAEIHARQKAPEWVGRPPSRDGARLVQGPGAVRRRG
jgi:hypothetical protein